jgi:hypothetical protein
VATGYGRDGDARGVLAFGLKVIKPFILTPDKGARTSVYVASSPELADVSGEYFVRCRPGRATRVAKDQEAAVRLWEASEKLVAEHAPA